MSQNANLFSAQAPVTPISATTSTPGSATALASIGNTARIVNESTIGAFVAIDTTAANAIAALPTAGARVSCWAGPGCDFTVSIPGHSLCYASAITRTGTAQLQIYSGEGS